MAPLPAEALSGKGEAACPRTDGDAVEESAEAFISATDEDEDGGIVVAVCTATAAFPSPPPPLRPPNGCGGGGGGGRVRETAAAAAGERATPFPATERGLGVPTCEGPARCATVVGTAIGDPTKEDCLDK